MIDNKFTITTQRHLSRNLGRNIKQWRKEKRLSQEDLAKAICTQQYIISHIETQPTFAPSFCMMIKLAAYFEKTFDELVT